MNTLAPTCASITSLDATITPIDPMQALHLGYLARCKCKSTLRAYQEDLRNYYAWCQQRQLNPLTVKRLHLDLYVRWMQEQGRWSESTISRRIGTVCGMYKYAAQEEILPKDPAAGVERPVVDREKQRRTLLNPVQFAQLLTIAQKAGTREHALICLLGMMGLRIGEACSLDVENMSVVKGYTVFSFLGKGNKAAVVAVPVPAMRAIDKLVKEVETGALLRNNRGVRMDRAAAGRMLRRLCRQAGVPTDISPHSLRRTFCTAGLLRGISIYDMQLAMRHASTVTTALYDGARQNLDRSATHQVAGYLSSLTG